MALVDEQFGVDDVGEFDLTAVSELCGNTKETAQTLLNHFVQVQGLAISQVNYILLKKLPVLIITYKIMY